MQATAKPRTENARGTRFFRFARHAFYTFMGVLTLLGLILNGVLFVARVFFPSTVEKPVPQSTRVTSPVTATPWPTLHHDPKDIVLPRARKE